MVLLVKSKTSQIATRDLHCYKVYIWWNGKYVSPHRKREMPKKNQTVFTELQADRTAKYIETGFQCFACYGDADLYTSHIMRINNLRTAIAMCTIPKGSRYYEGFYNHSVGYSSDTLIIREVIKDPYI